MQWEGCGYVYIYWNMLHKLQIRQIRWMDVISELGESMNDGKRGGLPDLYSWSMAAHWLKQPVV